MLSKTSQNKLKKLIIENKSKIKKKEDIQEANESNFEELLNEQEPNLKIQEEEKGMVNQLNKIETEKSNTEIKNILDVNIDTTESTEKNEDKSKKSLKIQKSANQKPELDKKGETKNNESNEDEKEEIKEIKTPIKDSKENNIDNDMSISSSEKNDDSYIEENSKNLINGLNFKSISSINNNQNNTSEQGFSEGNPSNPNNPQDTENVRAFIYEETEPNFDLNDMPLHGDMTYHQTYQNSPYYNIELGINNTFNINEEDEFDNLNMLDYLASFDEENDELLDLEANQNIGSNH